MVKKSDRNRKVTSDDNIGNHKRVLTLEERERLRAARKYVSIKLRVLLSKGFSSIYKLSSAPISCLNHQVLTRVDCPT